MKKIIMYCFIVILSITLLLGCSDSPKGQIVKQNDQILITSNNFDQIGGHAMDTPENDTGWLRIPTCRRNAFC